MKTLEGKILKHENCMDVAFLFQNFVDEDVDTYTFVGRWINVGLQSPTFIFQSVDKIKINKMDMPKWKEYKY